MKRQEQWQLHGNAPEIYERFLVPAVFAPWVPVLMESAALQPGERVLDVACGTGIVARGAAQTVGANGRVVGIDVNPGMLEIARAISPAPNAAVIEWREMSVDAMPFDDALFDVAFCQQGLQYFLDRGAALREIHRVLVFGGKLIISVWRSLEFAAGYTALAESLERHIGSQTRDTMRAPFSLGDAQELRSMISEAGFRKVNVQPKLGTVRFASAEEFVIRRLAGSPLADAVSAVDDEVRASIVDYVSNRLQLYVTDAGLIFPIETHIAVAHA
jgi:ubiquinone/menaquinone biosynthesis C-methylase UbiE